jgi:hypothetical protein
MSTIDVGSNLQWSTASTMTSWHHFRSTVTKNCQNLTKLWQYNDVGCKGALICIRTSLKGEQTLYICSMWMWEAIKGELRLNHDIMASFPFDNHTELLKTNQASVV